MPDMHMTANQTQRSTWIDAGKALGILLVVACHNPYIPIHQREIYSVVMSFHIPLFFALSGATISEHDTWQKSAVRSVSLIWVYLVAASVALPLVLLRPDATHAELSQTLLGILYGTGHTMHPGPLWFLPCLALSIPVAWTVLRALHAFRLSPMSINSLAAIVGMGLATANAYFLDYFPRTMVDSMKWGSFERSGAIWSADLVLIGAGFVLFGWALNKTLRSKPSAWQLIGIILLFALLILTFTPSTNIDGRLATPPMGAILVALAGVATTFLSLRQVSKCPSWILMIGAATLPILVMHQLLQKKLIVLLNGSLSNVTLISFVLSVTLAVGLPTVLDRFFFRKMLVGRLIFYPRTMLAKLG